MVVVHDSSGVRVACGVMEPTVGYFVALGAYPESSTGYNVTGTLLVTEAADGEIAIVGTVRGRRVRHA